MGVHNDIIARLTHQIQPSARYHCNKNQHHMLYTLGLPTARPGLDCTCPWGIHAWRSCPVDRNVPPHTDHQMLSLQCSPRSRCCRQVRASMHLRSRCGLRCRARRAQWRHCQNSTCPAGNLYSQWCCPCGCWNNKEVKINSLRAKLFRVNINVYLHFVSFLCIDMTHVLKILPQVRPGPTYST